MVREGLWLEGGIMPRFGAGARDVRGTRGTQRARRSRGGAEVEIGGEGGGREGLTVPETASKGTRLSIYKQVNHLAWIEVECDN